MLHLFNDMAMSHVSRDSHGTLCAGRLHAGGVKDLLALYY